MSLIFNWGREKRLVAFYLIFASTISSADTNLPNTTLTLQHIHSALSKSSQVVSRISAPSSLIDRDGIRNEITDSLQQLKKTRLEYSPSSLPTKSVENLFSGNFQIGSDQIRLYMEIELANIQKAWIELNKLEQFKTNLNVSKDLLDVIRESTEDVITNPETAWIESFTGISLTYLDATVNLPLDVKKALETVSVYKKSWNHFIEQSFTTNLATLSNLKKQSQVKLSLLRAMNQELENAIGKKDDFVNSDQVTKAITNTKITNAIKIALGEDLDHLENELDIIRTEIADTELEIRSIRSWLAKGYLCPNGHRSVHDCKLTEYIAQYRASRAYRLSKSSTLDNKILELEARYNEVLLELENKAQIENTSNEMNSKSLQDLKIVDEIRKEYVLLYKLGKGLLKNQIQTLNFQNLMPMLDRFENEWKAIRKKYSTHKV